MSFFALEFPNNKITISTEATEDVGLYVHKLTVSTQYTELFDNADIEICLPIQNTELRSKILNTIQNKTKVLIWQYSDSLLTKNKKLIMDGLVMQKKSNAKSINIMIYGKAWILKQTQLPPRFKPSSTTYIGLFQEILRKAGLADLFKDVIYPVRRNNVQLNNRLAQLENKNNELLSKYDQSIFEYLTIFLNEIQVYLTTVYIDNRMYLYHLDSAQMVQDKLSEDSNLALELFLNPRVANSNIIDYNIDFDCSNIYDDIIVSTKGNISQELQPVVVKVKRNGISQNNTEKKLSQSELPPALYTTRIKSDVGKEELQFYGKYLLKKQIRSALITEVTFVGHYPILRNYNKYWSIGMQINLPPVNINNEQNVLYNDLITYIDKKDMDFVVAGYSLIYDKEERKTQVTIVPSDFLEYDKVVKLQIPKLF